MGSSDFHVAMTDILLNGFAVAGKTDKMFPPLRPDQVGFGVPSSTGAGNGYIDPTQIQAAVDCIAKGSSCGSYTPKAGPYPDVRGVMTVSALRVRSAAFVGADGVDSGPSTGTSSTAARSARPCAPTSTASKGRDSPPHQRSKASHSAQPFIILHVFIIYTPGTSGARVGISSEDCDD